MTLEDLGYNKHFEESRQQLGLGGFSVARVISVHKGSYSVLNSDGEYQAKITGKHMFTASSKEDYPAVGDWVAISELPDGQAVVRHVLPRTTILKRTHGDKNVMGAKQETQVVATNVDVAFIIESVDRDYSLNRFERYSALAESGGVEAALILNKIDLLFNEELSERIAEVKSRFPDKIIITSSTLLERGLDDIERHLAPHKTYCFLGSSGVGKSSLINKLLGVDHIKTGDIGSHADRGKHTTTARHMYVLTHGAIVIDNPGTREVGIADVPEEVDEFFDDIRGAAEQCKFADCTHTHEPGCKVREAVAAKKVDKDHYENYLNLKKEAEYFGMSDYEKKEKDRQFGKFLKSAKKGLRDVGGK